MKGQLFSLDLLLSVIIIFLAVGVLMQHMEVNAYHLKDIDLREELEWVGTMASDRFVTNENIICRLYDVTVNENDLGSLVNCIDLDNLDAITKANLGVPQGFDCYITDGGGTVYGTVGSGCTTPLPPGAENIFSVERVIVVKAPSSPFENRVTKAELRDCMNREQNCVLTRETITLKVWRST